MLDEFLARNETYSVRKKDINRRTDDFFLYSPDLDDIITFSGTRVNMIHQKYKDMLKNSDYSSILKTCDHYFIEGEIYRYALNSLEKISGVKKLALVQQLKTKTKILETNPNDIATFIRLLIINGNMKGTKERKRKDRPLVRYVRPSELGMPFKICQNWNGNPYLTLDYDAKENTSQYDLPISEIKELMKDNFIKFDKDYHIALMLPKVINEDTIEQANKALEFEFGRRNDKPIFSVQLIDMPSLKGVEIC